MLPDTHRALLATILNRQYRLTTADAIGDAAMLDEGTGLLDCNAHCENKLLDVVSLCSLLSSKTIHVNSVAAQLQCAP